MLSKCCYRVGDIVSVDLLLMDGGKLDALLHHANNKIKHAKSRAVDAATLAGSPKYRGVHHLLETRDIVKGYRKIVYSNHFQGTDTKQ